MKIIISTILSIIITMIIAYIMREGFGIGSEYLIPFLVGFGLFYMDKDDEEEEI